ncbi:MAG: hypothetical protein ACR2QG_10105 [Gammaproteobacteria bacterium]
MNSISRISVFFIALAGSSVALASGAADESGTYRFVLFLHQLLFVLWLGPDIGVYMWSTKLTNPEVTPAQRAAAARMMTLIDVLPKACMSLMLTVGGVLTELMGIEHPWWQMAGIWLLGPVWLTLTLLTFFRRGTSSGPQLANIDILFRWLVVVGVIFSVGLSLTTDRLADTPWITGKLLLFVAVVFFSIMMRYRLKPLSAAVDELDTGEVSDQTNTLISQSVSRARLFMFASWLALAMAAGMGLVQPGDQRVETAGQELVVPDEEALF